MPPPTTTSRPGRLLGSLAVLIVILLLGVLAGSIAQPSNWHNRFKVHLGLDLSSGTTVTLKAVPPKGTSATQLASDMTTAQQIMSNRVNGAGFNGSSVTTQGTNLINVTVPGQGSKQVIDLVGTTALLRFRQVLLEAQNYTATTSAKVTPAGAGSGAHGLAASAKSLTSGTAAAKAEPKANASPSPSASATPSPSASASPSPSPSSSGKTSEKLSTTADGQGDASALSAKTKALFNKVNCADSNWKTKIYGKNPNNYDNTGTQVVTCYQGLKYALGKAIVTGSQLKLGGSSAVLQSNGNWYVDLNFNSQGTKAFGTFTSDLFSKYAGSSTEPLNYFAVVLDGAPASVAYISSAITTGSGQIEGNFTEAQADQLVNVLNYGALPLAFQEQSQQTVSAELGSTQLQAGLLAGAVGLFLVVVYAFLYYRGLGAVAISSLAISALLTFLSVVLLSLYEKFALSLASDVYVY